MIIYVGKYNWSGKKKGLKLPVSWWPGSYHLKIIDLTDEQPDVLKIKPVIIVVSDTGKGFSAKNYSQNLAKSVCKDFNLDLKKVLWIEYYPKEPVYMEVAMFKQLTKIGKEIIYSVKWRPIMANELEEIKDFVPEARQIIADNELKTG